MAVSHAKSITIGDFTGTVTAFNSQASTTTVAATDLARPADWNSAHNQYFTLTGNTNNASTVSGTNVVLSGGSNITLIGSGSVIGISAAAGGGGATVSRFDANSGHELLLGQMGQNTLWFQPVVLPHAVVANVVENLINFTANAASTGTYTITQQLAFYTQVNSTQISRSTSFQVTTHFNHSGTVNSGSNVNMRRWSGTFGAVTLPAGDYIVGFRSSTASSSHNATISNYIGSNINVAMSGRLMQAVNATNMHRMWQGSYSATSGGWPDTIGSSQMRGSAAINLRPPMWEIRYTA